MTKLLLLFFLFDVANAFPSIRWESLEKRTLKDRAPSDQRILQLRHRRALCAIIDFLDQVAIFKLGSGNRQGDGPAAQQFAQAFLKLVQAWLKETYNIYDATDRKSVV